MKQTALLNPRNSFLFLLLASLLLGSCNRPDFMPKSLGYYRLSLPEHRYEGLKGKFRRYPYAFEKSVHARLEDDTTRLYKPYWTNLRYPELEARIAITYYPLQYDTKKAFELSEDSRKLTKKHIIRAYMIDEELVATQTPDSAHLFELAGQVATQYQFFVTDSTENFFRGALYFKTARRNDSLAPVIKYIKKDIRHLLHTFRWNPDFNPADSLFKKKSRAREQG